MVEGKLVIKTENGNRMFYIADENNKLLEMVFFGDILFIDGERFDIDSGLVYKQPTKEYPELVSKAMAQRPAKLFISEVY